ncbi:hypothetical protein HDU98_005943, partial [Podochytrium sp. JEL0797]
ATHRDALFSSDVSMAQHLQQLHEVLGHIWPPFHKGYDACKRYALFRGKKNPEKPMSRSWLHECIVGGLTWIGKYIPNLVTHMDRKQGSYWREAMGCSKEKIEDANWGIKKGKKGVYHTVYNKGFSTEFIVVSTDHYVGTRKEPYFVPWATVEVPETLLDRTWAGCNRLFQLVDSGAPGFGDNDSFCGLVRALLASDAA